jgi:predicted  nucleic acid-binding Zn-ribbon protein
MSSNNKNRRNDHNHRDAAPAPERAVDAARSVVEAAERTLADLQGQRGAMLARSAELASERQRVSFAAFTLEGDGPRQLDQLRDEVAALDAELVDLESAISTARQRIADAKAALEKVEDQHRREQIAGELQALVEDAGHADQALAALVAAMHSMTDRLHATRRLGADHPSHEQLEAFTWRAVCTALEGTLLRRRVDRVPPLARTTFTAFTSQWAGRTNTDNEKDFAA